MVAPDFGGYIAATAGRPFDYRRDNCALWTAGAVEWCTGFDPAADVRRQGLGRFAMQRLVAQSGGLVAFVRPRMAHALFTPLPPGGTGVAVVRVAGRLVCGIVADGRVMARSETGVRLMDEFEILEGWTWSS